MAFPNSPLWTYYANHFISTSCTHDSGFKSIVFPARPNVGKVKTWHGEFIEGVDFRHPLEEYTRRYKTVEEAKAGHKGIVKMIKEINRKE